MAATDEIKNFYTWGSFLSLSVSAGAIWIVAGALSHAFDWRYPKYFPLILGLLFSIFGDFAAKSTNPWVTRLPLWFLNGCLIYVTAVGGTYVALEAQGKKEDSAIKAGVQNLSSQIDAIARTPEAQDSPEIQAVREEARNLKACIEGPEDASDCYEGQTIFTALNFIEPRELPSSLVSKWHELMSDARVVADDFETASGEIGFKRILTSLEE